MRNRILTVLGCTLLALAGYFLGARRTNVVYAQTMTHGSVPKSYGRMVTAIADSIGTGLVFEDEQGVIRFVSVTGMKEGELAPLRPDADPWWHPEILTDIWSPPWLATGPRGWSLRTHRA